MRLQVIGWQAVVAWGARMFGRGRRLFSVAAMLLIVVAGLHTMGHFSTPPDDPALRAVESSMAGYRIALPLGMNPSVRDVLDSLSLTMTITLLLVAVLDLIVAGSAVVSLGPFALANVIGIGALAALYGYYRISPPLVALTLVGLLFLAALLLPAGTATPPDAR